MMETRTSTRAIVTGVVVAIAMIACGQNAAPAVQAPAPDATSAIQGATAIVTGVEAHFNPTEGVGGGALGSNPVSDVTSIFATVPQASQLKITANSSPPGATGAEVQTVSVVAQDAGGLLKSLDATGKKNLGNALLTSAGSAWPNATISLLITDPAGGSLIGSRPKGGPNTVIAT
jgi:hypothetical protein